ncbi:MFS transporter [Enterococcus sp. LJL90]
MNTITLEKKSARQLHLTVLSSLFGDFGSSIFTFGLSFMLLERTGSVYSFALSAIISPIIGLVLLPFVGPLIDKYSRKLIIILSQSFTIVGLLAYWMAFPYIQNHLLAASVFLIAILKISDQFTSTARQASTIHLVIEKHLSKLSAYSQMTSSTAGVISSIFGAFFYTLLPFYLFILLELMTEILTLIFTSLLNFNFQKAAEKAAPVKQSQLTLFKEGLQFIKGQKYLLFGMTLALSVNFFLGIFSVGLPVLFLQALKASNLQFGFGEAINGFGFLIGGILIKKQQDVSEPIQHLYNKCLQLGLLITLFGFVVLIPANFLGILAVYGLMFISGYLIVTLNVPYTVWLQKNIPHQLQGRVFSVMSTCGMAIMPISILLFGYLFDLTAVSTVVLCSILFVATGLLLIIFTIMTSKLSKLKLDEAVIIPE